MHHAPDLEMMNSQNWNQTMDLGIVQTAKLTVVYAVAVLNSQCDKCTMWVHNECSYITETLYETAKFKLYLDLPEMRLLFSPDSSFDDQLNFENQNRFDPLTKEKKTRSSSNGTNKKQLRQWTEIY